MRKMYFVTGLAVLAVSASMFTGCGSQTTASAPAARQTTESTASTASTASAAPTATQAPAATESAAQSQPTQSTAAKVAENTTANTAAQITVDEAKNAALANAGLQESDVVYKKAQLETDDGILKYEIDFYAGDNEYNFDIDAATGAVLKAETEIMDAEDIAERDALLGTTASTATRADSEGITEDRALDIALNHAGVAKSDVTSSFVNKDFDDDRGVTTYDVEFHVGAQEYNYDIDMTTGDIYEFDSEMDD